VTGQELLEHIQSLAEELDSPVWICLGCERGEKDPDYWYVYGEAIRFGNDNPFIVMTETPDEPIPYLIALHELGHHADQLWGKGLRLDREVFAWCWALEHSLVPTGPRAWGRIARSLRSYAQDKRYKRTDNFERLLAEAEWNAAE
jgi:hypothetical protein